jgi:hypothetical protein
MYWLRVYEVEHCIRKVCWNIFGTTVMHKCLCISTDASSKTSLFLLCSFQVLNKCK